MENNNQSIIEGKIEVNYKIINDELMIIETYCDGILIDKSFNMKHIQKIKDLDQKKNDKEKQEKYLAEKYDIDIDRKSILEFNSTPDSTDEFICHSEGRRAYLTNTLRKVAGWSRWDTKRISIDKNLMLTREEAYQKDEKEKIEIQKRNEYYSDIRKKFLNCSEEKICESCSEEKICNNKIETKLREFFPCCKRISYYNVNQNYVGCVRPFNFENETQEKIDKCHKCGSYQKYKNSEIIHIINKDIIEGKNIDS